MQLFHLGESSFTKGKVEREYAMIVIGFFGSIEWYRGKDRPEAGNLAVFPRHALYGIFTSALGGNKH